MLTFKRYLYEIWNPQEHEYVDMSGAYTGISTLSDFPTVHARAAHQMRITDLVMQQRNFPNRFEELQGEIDQQTREFNRRSDESVTASEDDAEKKVKTRLHFYSYPTLEDIERIKRTAVNGMIPISKHISAGQRLVNVEDVLKNPHLYPGHHSGEISFRESLGDPTEVMITEHGRWNKNADQETTTKHAMNTYKYVLSAIKHFTGMPVQKWNISDRTSPLYREFGTDVGIPHRITDVPDGVHTFSGSTADPRKHRFYEIVTGLLGHKFFNTTGKPYITSKQQRRFRRTGSYD